MCSTHQPGPEVRSILSGGPFGEVLLGLNILNFPYRWDGVLAAGELGCGVVAMNPLAGGAIPSHEQALSFLARDGETATDAAIRFLVSCPQVAVALIGFATREHIDQACRVADTATPFTDAELDEFRAQLGRNMDAMCTGCGYCTGCPRNIPIPGYMQVYNEKQIFGADEAEMKRQMQHHHSWGWLVGRQAAAAECIECGVCEEACTQHLPIVDRLREMAGWEQSSS